MPQALTASARLSSNPATTPATPWSVGTRQSWDEPLAWTSTEIRALDKDQARAASDMLLRRLCDLDRASALYSRVRTRVVEINMSLVRFALRGLTNRTVP